MLAGDDEGSDIFSDIERSIEEAFSGFQRSLFDLDKKCLRPLYRIEASEENVTVTFDLPCVEKKEDLNLTSTEDTLSIEAKMNKPISLMVGGPYQRRVEFDKYAKKIRLPVKVEPNLAHAKFQNGILVIEFPVKRTGNVLKIE